MSANESTFKTLIKHRNFKQEKTMTADVFKL